MTTPKEKINVLRNEIDRIDDEIVKNISIRVEVAKNIGIIKRENNLAILDGKREEEIIKKVGRVGKHDAKGNKINQRQIVDIFKRIIQLCKENE